MFQKSVVVVSRYPYVNLFERLVKVSLRWWVRGGLQVGYGWSRPLAASEMVAWCPLSRRKGMVVDIYKTQERVIF